jgi:hypothetical protein
MNLAVYQAVRSDRGRPIVVVGPTAVRMTKVFGTTQGRPTDLALFVSIT